jgi:hypothetical protein
MEQQRKILGVCKRMQVLLGHTMCWDVINEDVTAEMNPLGHHMRQS